MPAARIYHKFSSPHEARREPWCAKQEPSGQHDWTAMSCNAYHVPVIEFGELVAIFERHPEIFDPSEGLLQKPEFERGLLPASANLDSS